LKKRGGSREKGGGGNEIHAPCACVKNEWVREWVSDRCLKKRMYIGVQ
jgi:hypothetical protein